MIALAMLLAPPAPSGPLRTVPIPPFAWECELAGTGWERFRLSGTFGKFPSETDPGRGGTDATVGSDTSGRFSGVHKVYPVSANAASGRGRYNMIVQRPNRTFYHVHFEFYGRDRLASVTVEEQLLATPSGIMSATAVGFCRVKDR